MNSLPTLVALVVVGTLALVAVRWRRDASQVARELVARGEPALRVAKRTRLAQDLVSVLVYRRSIEKPVMRKIVPAAARTAAKGAEKARTAPTLLAS